MGVEGESPLERRQSPKTEVVERVKAILEIRGLTLYQISQKTRNLYGGSSPHLLPHNLYYDVGLGTFSPSLHQIFALSKISGYRFYDWLRVFGFNPEAITRMQTLLSSKRTVILDSYLDDSDSLIPWFRNQPGNLPIPAIAPIGQLLNLAPPKRLSSLQSTRGAEFVYARIGLEDDFAFPDLLPGSIVRANTRLAKSMLHEANGRKPPRLFLIEHANGFCCCRIQELDEHRITPISTQLPYAQVELELPREARILGVLDLEIRSLLKPEQPDVPKELASQWRPQTLPPREKKLSQLLRNARLRTGLSFRDASAMSRNVAVALGDEQYFTAPGSLSDYEARDYPPRHIHKAITLCAVYGLQFGTFLEILGLHEEQAGKDRIPDYLVPRKVQSRPSGTDTDVLTRNGFLQKMLSRLEHVPFFLRNSLTDLSGLKTLSLHDFFWIGGELNPIHPLLANGLIVVVNRHRKRALHFRSRPLWQQPLYVLLRRDGTYICGCCSLENGWLVIHPYSSDYQAPERMRNHDDAEVVGEIVTVARRLW